MFKIEGTMHAIVFVDGDREFICTSTRHYYFSANTSAWAVALISKSKTAEKACRDLWKRSHRPGTIQLWDENNEMHYVDVRPEQLEVREVVLGVSAK